MLSGTISQTGSGLLYVCGSTFIQGWNGSFIQLRGVCNVSEHDVKVELRSTCDHAADLF